MGAKRLGADPRLTPSFPDTSHKTPPAAPHSTYAREPGYFCITHQKGIFQKSFSGTSYQKPQNYQVKIASAYSTDMYCNMPF